jgi:hypothetical protein
VSPTEYIDYIFLRCIQGSDFDKVAGDLWIPSEDLRRLFEQAMVNAVKSYGYDIKDQYQRLIDVHWDSMVENDIISQEGDEFAGYYLRLSVSDKDQYISDRFASSAIAQRIRVLGEPALRRAIENVAKMESWNTREVPDTSGAMKVQPIYLEDPSHAPAADRIVSLAHNQQAQLEEVIEEVVDRLQHENSNDGDSATRQRFLGELAAGKELIRAQSVRAFLLYETLFKLLGTLIEKYKGSALAEAAKKLLDLLIDHVFGKA